MKLKTLKEFNIILNSILKNHIDLGCEKFCKWEKFPTNEVVREVVEDNKG